MKLIRRLAMQFPYIDVENHRDACSLAIHPDSVTTMRHFGKHSPRLEMIYLEIPLLNPIFKRDYPPEELVELLETLVQDYKKTFPKMKEVWLPDPDRHTNNSCMVPVLRGLIERNGWACRVESTVG